MGVGVVNDAVHISAIAFASIQYIFYAFINYHMTVAVFFKYRLSIFGDK